MRIVISSRPVGEAPEWVRDAWIGIELETVADEPTLDERAQGVLSRKFVPTYGYSVSSRTALAALQEADQLAAFTWWLVNTAHPRDDLTFVFNSECYTVVID